MTLRSWRLIKAKNADTAFTGEGARLYGGRWNSPGRKVVYTSATLSLAILEILVHLDSNQLLPSYSIYDAEFDERLVTRVSTDSLPGNWRAYPAPPATQQVGDRWLVEQTSAVLQFPSVIVPLEHNYLLNPEHTDFAKIKLNGPHPFPIDPRLLK